ncbi:MAG: hypothetical protein ACI8RT_001417 [Candidatus Azotimanducaceae bacterium]|mgnify:CR=1 FL=1
MKLTIDEPEAIREFAYAQGWLPRGVEVTRLETADTSATTCLRGYLSNETTLVFKQADGPSDTHASFMAMVEAANELHHQEGEQPVLLGYAEEEKILCMRDIAQESTN